MAGLRKLFCVFILFINDVAALLTSFLLAYFLRSQLLLFLIPRFKSQPPLPLDVQLRLGFAYGAIVMILVLFYGRLYTQRFSFWEETKYLFKSVSISFIFILVLVFVSRQYIFFSRATIAMAWILSLVVFPLFRYFTKKILFSLGIWKKRVVIIGTNETSHLLVEGIKSNRNLGYEIVGFLTENEKKIGEVFSGYKVLGTISQGNSVNELENVKDFIVALPSHSQEELVEIMENFDERAETIRMVPNIGSLFTLGVRVESLGDVLALNLNRNLFKPWNILLKVCFEYILIILFSILILPLFLVIILLIKLNSKGPVFFIQDRIGKNGKSFRIIKFRSMFVDGDQKLEDYLKNNPQIRREWEEFQKIKGFDPRVTGVGKFIRKYSLDEIPQIFNVLRGEMSLVGPRPYLPREREILDKSSTFISKIKPGITGLWQVRGRNLLPFKKRILLDEYYIRNWSLWLDIVILVQTPRILARKQGAF